MYIKCPKSTDFTFKEKFVGRIVIVVTKKFYHCLAYKIFNI